MRSASARTATRTEPPRPPSAGCGSTDGSDGDQGIGARPHGVAHEELQFSRLVSAPRQPGQVVALDPEFRSAQVRAEIRELMNRRGR